MIKLLLPLMAFALLATGCGNGCSCGGDDASTDPTQVEEQEDLSGLEPIERHERLVSKMLKDTKSPAVYDRVKHKPLVDLALKVTADRKLVTGTARYVIANPTDSARGDLVFALPTTQPSGRKTDAKVTSATFGDAAASFKVTNGLVTVDEAIPANDVGVVTLNFTIPVTKADSNPQWGTVTSDHASVLALHAGGNAYSGAAVTRFDVLSLNNALPSLLTPEFQKKLRGDKPLRAHHRQAGARDVMHLTLRVSHPEGWIVAAPGTEQVKDDRTTWRLSAARSLSLSMSPKFVRTTQEVAGVRVDSFVIKGADKQHKAYVDAASSYLPVMSKRLGTFPFSRLVVTQCAVDRAGFVASGGYIGMSNLLYGKDDFLRDRVSVLNFLARHDYFVLWRRYLVGTGLGLQWWGEVAGIDTFGDIGLVEGLARNTALLAMVEAGESQEVLDAVVRPLMSNLSHAMARSFKLDAPRKNLLNEFEIAAAFEGFTQLAQKARQRLGAGAYDQLEQGLLERHGYRQMAQIHYKDGLAAAASGDRSMAGFVDDWWLEGAAAKEQPPLDVIGALTYLGGLVPNDQEGSAFLRALSQNRELAELLHPSLNAGVDMRLDMLWGLATSAVADQADIDMALVAAEEKAAEGDQLPDELLADFKKLPPALGALHKKLHPIVVRHDAPPFVGLRLMPAVQLIDAAYHWR